MAKRAIAQVRELQTALREACGNIQSELNAAGEDEVRQHPTLRRKQRFVDQQNKRIKRVEDWIAAENKRTMQRALHGAQAIDIMLRHSDADELLRMLGTNDIIARMAALILAAQKDIGRP